MDVKIKKLREDAIIPTYSTASSAGCDLYAMLDDNERVILPHHTLKIRTGIAMEIPDYCVGLVYARSGLATKHGIRLANSVGVIDNDYRGEIMVVLRNDSNEPYAIQNHERVAQLVITPYLQVNFNETDELTTTARGNGGFGSTGKN